MEEIGRVKSHSDKNFQKYQTLLVPIEVVGVKWESFWETSHSIRTVGISDPKAIPHDCQIETKSHNEVL